MPYSDDEIWADMYDIIYSGREMGDVDFYVGKSKETDGKVLEIGCGTGRIYLELLEEGVDAYGIDISEPMLEKLREKAEERGLDSKVRKATMTDFSIEEKFSLVIIPFRTFLHNITQEDQIDALKNIRSHLKEDGKLILNFYPPDLDYIANEYGSKSEEKVEYNGDQYTVETYTRLKNEIDMINEFKRTLYKGGEKIAQAKAQNKMIFKDEFKLLLEQAGFEDYQVYGDFELETLDNTEQEMIWVAQP